MGKKMEKKIELVNTDGQNIGEYIVTDGGEHMLCSPYGNRIISDMQFDSIIKQHKAAK